MRHAARVTVHFVTHPEVEVDPSVPVPEWGLSSAGRSRLDRLLELPWTRTADRVASSAERKARQTADALADVVGVEPDDDLVIVSHGGVGTLLLCWLAGVDIDRRHDQPGQGSWFSFDGGSRRLLHGWRRI